MDLAERLAPDALEVVAAVAGRARGQDAGGAEDLGRDADERRLADAALAEHDSMLAGLVDGREQIAELRSPTGEERAPVDRRRRPEGGVERLQAFDLLRLTPFQPRTHPLDPRGRAIQVPVPATAGPSSDGGPLDRMPGR